MNHSFNVLLNVLSTYIAVIIIQMDYSCVGRSSLTNEKDHHYFLNRFVCVGEFFDG